MLTTLLDRLRDPAIRAAWTFLYVFVGTLAVSLTPVGDTLDLDVAKAAVIAAALAGVKTILALRFGDPVAIRTNLSDFGVRLFHTAWQSLVAVFIAGGLNLDRATLVATLLAVILNAIKTTILPPLPTDAPAPENGGDQDPAGDLPVDETDVTADPAPVDEPVIEDSTDTPVEGDAPAAGPQD